jgi:serine/threonine protein kinase
MGEVYKARDTRLNRTVAIKVLSRNMADRPEVRQRFEREARAVSSLNHPHICTLYDIGRQDAIDFLVMEYLDGETLASRLKKGPLPLHQVFEYAIQIADALAQAHRRGVIHRDLKPGNIMVTRSGAKVLDFGLAKVQPVDAVTGLTQRTESLTEEGAILGTLQYMAPEQLEGGEADARTDIFAFGAVVYEMLTAKKAFAGKSRASVIAAILEREPPPLTALDPMTARRTGPCGEEVSSKRSRGAMANRPGPTRRIEVDRGKAIVNGIVRPDITKRQSSRTGRVDRRRAGRGPGHGPDRLARDGQKADAAAARAFQHHGARDRPLTVYRGSEARLKQRLILASGKPTGLRREY